jgi:hypothetical protein
MKFAAVNVKVVAPAIPVPVGDCTIVPVVVLGPLGVGGDGLFPPHAMAAPRAMRKNVRNRMRGLYYDGGSPHHRKRQRVIDADVVLHIGIARDASLLAYLPDGTTP